MHRITLEDLYQAFTQRLREESPVKHTKGKWKVSAPTKVRDACAYVVGDSGNTIADMRYKNGAEDCKRIVACVNALEGFPTFALEAGIVGEMVKLLQKYHDFVPSPESKALLSKIKES